MSKITSISDVKNKIDGDKFRELQAQFMLDIFIHENRRHATDTHELERYIESLPDGTMARLKKDLFEGWSFARRVDEITPSSDD